MTYTWHEAQARKKLVDKAMRKAARRLRDKHPEDYRKLYDEEAARLGLKEKS